MKETKKSVNKIRKHLVIQCTKCNDIIKSNHRHVFKSCSCGSIYIDGGYDNARLGFKNKDDYKELHIEDENGNKHTIERKKPKAPSDRLIKESNQPLKKKKRKQRITVASAKTKGRNLQKWACEIIGKLLNLSWGYEDDKLIQPRIMGQSGVDVVLRGEAFDRFSFDVECKNQESWSIPAYIRQAKKNTKKYRNWLLVLKRKEFQKPIVVLEANKFFELLDRIHDKKQL